MCVGLVGSNLYPGTLSAGITSPVKSAPVVISALISNDALLEFPFESPSIAPFSSASFKAPLNVILFLALNAFLFDTSIASKRSFNLLDNSLTSFLTISFAFTTTFSTTSLLDFSIFESMAVLNWSN